MGGVRDSGKNGENGERRRSGRYNSGRSREGLEEGEIEGEVEKGGRRSRRWLEVWENGGRRRRKVGGEREKEVGGGVGERREKRVKGGRSEGKRGGRRVEGWGGRREDEG